jgi:hypothetical protein
MTESEFLEIYHSNIPNINKFTRIGRACSAMKWLHEKIPLDINLNEKAYLYANGLTNPPLCTICLNSVKFNGFSRGYQSVCSSRCAGKRAQEISGKEIHRKGEETMIKKFGVKSPFQLDNAKKTARLNHFTGQTSEESRKLRKDKLQQRYGVTCTAQIPTVRDKITKTMNDRYGGYFIASDEAQELRREKWLKLKIEKLESIYQTKLLSAYTHSKDLHKAQCLLCFTEFNLSVANGIISRCPKCYFVPANRSLKEMELSKFIQSLGFIAETNVKRKELIYPLSLDIFIPEKRIAIEFNGNYWHSEVHKDKMYHLEKLEKCLEKDIQLIQIFEYEYDINRILVESRLRSLLGCNSKSIGARELKLKPLTKLEAEIFFENNHLQGPVISKAVLGLCENDNVFMAIAIGKPRFNKAFDLELLRIATLQGVTVIGGASRLMCEINRLYPNQSFISYHDRRWGLGSFYEKLGFKHSHYSGPGYVYVKGPQIISRFGAWKNRLQKLLGKDYDENLSQSENMTKARYLKLWDCGQKVFIKHK